MREASQSCASRCEAQGGSPAAFEQLVHATIRPLSKLHPYDKHNVSSLYTQLVPMRMRDLPGMTPGNWFEVPWN